ncbi:MAG: MoxR family ATPase, partial [bacterium]|nr:MoxR family ATPase [bacterium]
VSRMLVGLLANGHILIEGVPGLAKTYAVRTVAAAVKARYQRIQFTPDLLPSDIVGTLIYNQKTGEFITSKGPIFANFILADEINRTPPKVQSALLEAMQERQVTIGEQTFKLDDPFLVLATQNPIEQEGTYPLPEAQLDRFLLKIKITYPSKEEEKEIVERIAGTGEPKIKPVIDTSDIIKARELCKSIYIDKKIKDYIVDLVFATREPEKYGLKDLKGLVRFGASPRASINLTTAARALAFLKRRGFVIPEDVKELAGDILRHRIILSYEAEAEEVSTDDVIQKILAGVEVP